MVNIADLCYLIIVVPSPGVRGALGRPQIGFFGDYSFHFVMFLSLSACARPSTMSSATYCTSYLRPIVYLDGTMAEGGGVDCTAEHGNKEQSVSRIFFSRRVENLMPQAPKPAIMAEAEEEEVGRGPCKHLMAQRRAPDARRAKETTLCTPAQSASAENKVCTRYLFPLDLLPIFFFTSLHPSVFGRRPGRKISNIT